MAPSSPTLLAPLHRNKVHPLPLQQMTSDAAVFAKKASVLAGKFRGNGVALLHGKQVPYDHECSLTLVRKNPNMVVYRLQQDTKHENKPLHLEVGILKIFNSSEDDGMLPAEAGMTHPLGTTTTVNERCKGSLDTETSTLVLESRGFPKNGEQKKHVTALKRIYRLQGDTLVYDQYLGVNGGELTRHLHCELVLQE